jgi:4-hydroxymandelate synthase
MDVASVDHAEFYVGDAQQTAFFLCTAFGFHLYGQGGPETGLAGQRSLLLGHGRIRVLLTSGLTADHPAARYVQRHGDGVACIGMSTADAGKAYEEATGRGARAVAEPKLWRRGDAEVVTATVSGFGDVTHRLVERRATDEFLPGGIEPVAVPEEPSEPLLDTIDHLAVCVPSGELDSTVDEYRNVFDFHQIFEERIEVGAQAMNSVVVQSPSRGVTLTIIAPDPTTQPGQINDFLRAHDGAGVQHLAFSTPDIVHAVDVLGGRGVRFLTTPASYYDQIETRLGHIGRPAERLRAGNILVDQDHWGQMFQIFTEAAFVRRTLFFELIERQGALTFGSNNIKALYEAKERERGLGAGTTAAS